MNTRPLTSATSTFRVAARGDRLYRALHRQRQAQGLREVIERPEWQDAQWHARVR